MQRFLDRFLIIFFITSIIYEIITIWFGILWFKPLTFFVISLISAVLLLRLKPIDFKTPLWVWGIGIAFALILAIPTIFLNLGVSASSDAFQTIMVRAMQSSAPKNFMPYSPLPYVYPFGFHLLAKPITNILFFLHDYQVLWFMGLVFITTLPVLFYYFFNNLLKNKSLGFWAAVIIFGNKIYLTDFLYGIYPELLGLCLFFFSGMLYKKNNFLFWGSLATLFIVHPISAVMGMLFWGLYFLLHKEYKNLFYLPLTSLFILPTLSTYLLAGNTIIHPAPGITSFFSKGFKPWTLLNWIGPAPSAIFLFSLIIFFLMRSSIDKSIIKIIKLFSLMAALLLSCIYFTSLYPWKMVHVLSFAIISFSVIGLDTITKSYSYSIKKMIVFFLLMLFVITIFFSKTLKSLYFGNKISKNEIKAAYEFGKVIPKKSKVLFLTSDFSTSGAMMGMITDTIPYGLGGYFLPEDPPLTYNSAYIENQKDQVNLNKIIKDSCMTCFKTVHSDYFVVNNLQFKNKLEFKEIKKFENFSLYANNSINVDKAIKNNAVPNSFLPSLSPP